MYCHGPVGTQNLSFIERLNVLCPLREVSLYMYLGKVEEWPWVVLEVVDVKHCLGIRQVRILNSKSCIHTIGWPKIRYSTWNRNLSKYILVILHSNCTFVTRWSIQVTVYQVSFMGQKFHERGLCSNPVCKLKHLEFKTCWPCKYTQCSYRHYNSCSAFSSKKYQVQEKYLSLLLYCHGRNDRKQKASGVWQLEEFIVHWFKISILIESLLKLH